MVISLLNKCSDYEENQESNEQMTKTDEIREPPNEDNSKQKKKKSTEPIRQSKRIQALSQNVTKISEATTSVQTQMEEEEREYSESEERIELPSYTKPRGKYTPRTKTKAAGGKYKPYHTSEADKEKEWNKDQWNKFIEHILGKQ